MSDPARPEPTQDCCDVWIELVHLFNWKVLSNQSDLAVMPYVKGKGHEWRINHCPSCGKDVRDCVISRERLADAIF
jgi:hypothetical protein